MVHGQQWVTDDQQRYRQTRRTISLTGHPFYRKLGDEVLFVEGANDYRHHLALRQEIKRYPEDESL